MPNVTIVSNRLPVSVKRTDGGLEFYQSVGGLATGLSSYVNDKKNKWIGWPGIAADDLTEEEKQTIAHTLAKSNCYPVFLTQKQLDDYYNGFANTILWPLLHNLPLKFTEHDQFWKAYRDANNLFAETVLALTDPGSTIWVHDYQIMLVPKLIRAERPRSTIGFFLHVPFPSSEIFSKLSYGKALLSGLLAADLVGLHTNSYSENFLDTCRMLKVGTVSLNKVKLGSHVAQVTSFPMGIDYERFSKAVHTKTIRKDARKLRWQYGYRKIIFTNDRVDPTKGLIYRLEGYREFLRTNPYFLGKVVMVMLATPSRIELVEYQKLKAAIEKIVKDINHTYGTRSWQPVDYMYKAIPLEDVSTYYKIADVAFIAPLRDGMNLVAKEFVASKTRRKGVLILSETAGAAEELTNAILVDPTDTTLTALALYQALTMPRSELKWRLRIMQKHLSTHTSKDWMTKFISSLNSASIKPSRTKKLDRKAEQQLISTFKIAQKRKILLDYDGVVVPLIDIPSLAKPSDSKYELLESLASPEQTDVAIISGRSKDDLKRWLGKLPVALIAEHGAVMRLTGQKWQKNNVKNADWKQLVRPILDEHALKTPGAFVEGKDYSLVWHYRKTPPYYAQKNVVILKKVLKQTLRNTGLGVYSGNKILEVRSPQSNKGIAATKWLKGNPDFIMAIGDDYTDEDMFMALPKSAYTIKVGPGKTEARYRLKTINDVTRLLKKLA